MHGRPLFLVLIREDNIRWVGEPPTPQRCGRDRAPEFLVSPSGWQGASHGEGLSARGGSFLLQLTLTRVFYVSAFRGSRFNPILDMLAAFKKGEVGGVKVHVDRLQVVPEPRRLCGRDASPREGAAGLPAVRWVCGLALRRGVLRARLPAPVATALLARSSRPSA